MTTLAEQLKANEDRLTAAWGDALPAFDDRVRAAVARAVEAAGQPGGRGPQVHTLADLASAWRATGNPDCARLARRYFESRLAEETDDSGNWILPAEYNELSIPHHLGDTECVGCFGALPALLDSGQFDEPLLARIVQWARGQFNYLADNIFEGRNIRMTQGDGLFTQAMRLSMLHDSPRWRRVGLQVLNDAFSRQIQPDGTAEATGWYHFIVMNMALRYWRLKQAMPELPIQMTADKVARMFDYTAGAVEPCGHLNRIGDCTAGLGPDTTLQSVLDRHLAVRRELSMPAALPPTSQYFPDARQAFLRDGWTADATYITFDATRRYGYHWHPSLNAVQLHVRGVRVLADPGRMSYELTPQRLYAVSTRAHSTMNLNGLNQISVKPVVRHRSTADYDVVDSLYPGGYWTPEQRRGVFGEHHRTLLWIRGRMIVVIDNMQHCQREGEKPTIECNWQFAPGRVRIDPGRPCVWTEHDGERMLMLFPLQPPGTTMTLHEGEQGPNGCAGWVADVDDQPVPAPQLRCAVEDFDPWNADLATVLIPYRDEAPHAAVERVVYPERNNKTGHFALRWADGTSDEFWWKRRLEFALETCGQFTTDAALLHVRTDADGRPTQAMAFDGSYVEPCTKTVLARPATFVWQPTGPGA